MERTDILKILFNFLEMLNGVNIKSFHQPINYHHRQGIQNLISKAKNVARDINNSIYTTDQFIKFLFIEAMLKGKSGIYAFKVKDIIKVRKITEKYAKKDEAIVEKICHKYGMLVEELVEIKDDGESIIYKLFLTNHISVAYILKNYKNILTIAEHNAILFNTKYRLFHNTLIQFIHFIKGEKYAEVQV